MNSTWGRNLLLAYGGLAYLAFVASILYLVGFLGNLVVPRSVDRGSDAALSVALVVDTLLIALFGLQHSTMARPGVKRWLAGRLPRPMERSTFVLVASIVLFAIYVFWLPMPDAVWQVESLPMRIVLWALFFSGWMTALLSTFLINHFDLFGLRQVYLQARGRAYEPLPFAKKGLYRLVRHPINLGFLIAIWATPDMTYGHLLLSVGMTAYILIATPLEERDLLRVHGDRYRKYKNEVPMLLPFRLRS